MIDGKPVYGTEALLRKVPPEGPLSEISVQGAKRLVALPADPRFGSWESLVERLDGELRQVGSRLGPLVGP